MIGERLRVTALLWITKARRFIQHAVNAAHLKKTVRIVLRLLTRHTQQIQ
jgi:hypothetical protein